MKVLTWLDGRREEINAGLPYATMDYFIGMPRSQLRYMPQDAVSLSWRVKQEEPDVVMVNIGAVGIYAAQVARRMRKKVICRMGGHIYDEQRSSRLWYQDKRLFQRAKNDVYFKTMHWVLRYCDAIIVVSEEMRHKFIMESGISPDKVHVVTVPCDYLRYDLPKVKVLAKTIITVSTVDYWQKVDGVLRVVGATSRLLKSYVGLRHLVVIPGRYHSMIANILKGHYGELVRRGKLVICEYSDNIPAMLAESSVMVYWSELDGCPNVVLEAFASRTPLIVNRCRWSVEMIPPDCAIKVENQNQMVDHLEYYLFDLPRADDDMVNRAYQFVQREHSTAKVGAQLAKVLESL